MRYIAKCTIEEFYDEGKRKDSLRAYNLRTIKIESAGGREGIIPTTPDVGEDSIISISDLYRTVKENDSEFQEGMHKISNHIIVDNKQITGAKERCSYVPLSRFGI